MESLRIQRLRKVMEKRRHNFSDIRINEFGENLNSDESIDEYQSDSDKESEDEYENTHRERLLRENQILECKKCNSTFRWRSDMITHMKTFNPGTFKCNRCSYCMNNQSMLEKHVHLLHNEDESYRSFSQNTCCDTDMSQDFVSSDDDTQREILGSASHMKDQSLINEHVILHHAENSVTDLENTDGTSEQTAIFGEELETLNCILCNKYFSRKDNFNHHMSNVHGKNKNK